MQMVQGDNHKACILAVVQWKKNSCTHAFARVATEPTSIKMQYCSLTYTMYMYLLLIPDA